MSAEEAARTMEERLLAGPVTNDHGHLDCQVCAKACAAFRLEGVNANEAQQASFIAQHPLLMCHPCFIKVVSGVIVTDPRSLLEAIPGAMVIQVQGGQTTVFKGGGHGG